MADIRETLRQVAIQIRDEHKLGANTAKRVGAFLLSLVDSGIYNEELEELFLSKTKSDKAAEIIDFLKGLTVNGDKASIDANGVATVQQLIALLKAKATDLEVTNTATAKNFTASDKVTTLNLLVQKLADTYNLNVSNVATLFRTTIKDYVSSETFISGFAGEGFKLYKALSGDWNLEVDNVTIRKAMTVFELIISKIRAVNGGLVVSLANGRVKSVSETTGTPAYYVLGIEGDMTFEADDFVRCQVFSSTGAKYYWVRVDSISDDSIVIAQSEFPEGTVPAVGDDLVQMGNKTNTARQGLLYLTASEDGKPRFSVLNGVDSTDLTGKNKLILGCLDGITDSDFPDDAQPSGYGLWAANVFLKGLFILRNGKSVEDELSDQIKAVKTAFEIREGQISTKVQAATTAATQASGSASAAAGSASTAGSSATSAANSANAASSALQSVTTKQSEINQTASKITLQVSEVTTKTAQAANSAELATAMSKGKMLYRDPVFASGLNNVNTYNNNGNGQVTISRVSGISGNPNDSGYCLKIVSNGSASPGLGGFYFANQARANAIFITRFIANIPVGYTVEWGSNPVGTGGGRTWLTSQAGTGTWTEYVCKVQCGSSGSFSSTNFFYLVSGSTPVIWYLAYATVFDVTGVDDTPSRDEIKAGISIVSGGITIFGQALSLAGKVTFSSLDSSAQSTINAKATKTEAQGYATSAVDAVQVGGANTYSNLSTSIAQYNEAYLERNTSSVPNGLYLVGRKTYDSWIRISNVITENGWWTISFYMRGSQSASVGFNIDICDIGGARFNANTDNEWHYYSYTINVTNYSASTYNFVDFSGISWAYIFVKDLKIEHGNKATRWTPHYLDVSSDATNKANAAKENLATSLGYSSYSAMEAQAVAGRSIINGAYINTGLLAARAITADKIAAGTITSTEINVSSLQAALVTAAKINSLDITTNKLTVANNCKIGDFTIYNGMIKSTQSVSDINAMSVELSIKGLSTGRVNGGVQGVSIGDFTSVIDGVATPTGLIISALGGYAINANGSVKIDGNIKMSSGSISGFAIKARRVSSTSVYLDNTDSFVSIVSSSLTYVYLPPSPPIGKVIFVCRAAHVGIRIYGNGHSVYNSGSYPTYTEINRDGEIDMLVYDGQCWRYGWLND